MCGIVGLVLRQGLNGTGLARAPKNITRLLLCAEWGGPHATGMMVIQPDRVDVLKMLGPAERFVATDEYDELMASITSETIAVVGHTRWATVGSPEDNDNNHPITDGNIMLVHNGSIDNHEELDYRYGSVAEVDSASLAAAVRAHSCDEGGLTADSLEHACQEAWGTIATVVADRNWPDRVFAYRNNDVGRSLYGMQGPSGYWFGSTGKILRRAGVTSRPCVEIPIDRAVRLTCTGPVYDE